jgi:hypothetical protein
LASVAAAVTPGTSPLLTASFRTLSAWAFMARSSWIGLQLP